MKIKKIVKEKKATILAFTPAILLILLFILSKIGIITDEFTTSLIQLISIIIALLIPFIIKESEKRKETRKLKEVQQDCFSNIAELCMLCIERRDQRLEYDIKVFQLSRKIKKYSNELLDLDITYNEAMPRSTHSQSESIVIENNLRIALNVDNAEGKVWSAMLNIIDVNDNDKEKKKLEAYKILEGIRKDNDLEWNEECINYFKVKTT